MAGDNYTFKLPTEELKTQLEAANAELARFRSLLAQAIETRCPDRDCPNCRRHRNWAAWSGDVHWLTCPVCKAEPGKPCRDQRGGPNRPLGARLVLMRPHRARTWAPHPPEAPI